MAAKYEPMGTVAEDQPRSADQSMIVFLGVNGCGKSHLLQSHPGCAIVNFQQTPTTHANPVAEMWPKDSGEPIRWNEFTDYVDHIVKSNLAGLKGSPRTIGIDSYLDMVECAWLYSAWMMNCRRNKDTKKTISEFTIWDAINEDGMAVWGMAYAWIKDVIRTCKAAYVGLAFVVPVEHLMIEHVVRRETIKEERLEPMVTGKQFRILRDSADALLYVTKEKRNRSVQQEVDVIIRGEKVKKMRSVTVPGVRQVILSDHEPMHRYIKVRSSKMLLPETIDISDTGWAGFAESWNKSAGISPS